MEEYKYRLYCSECEKVTPHDVVDVEPFEPEDTGSSNIYLKYMNIVINLFSGMLSSAPQGDYKCVKCGNKFNNPTFLD